jgi:transcriptional regulator with XRE-family HTH domain
MTYDIAAAINKVIARSGKTQRQIASESGVHFTTISRWSTANKTPRVTELDEMLRTTGHAIRIVNIETGEVVDP